MSALRDSVVEFVGRVKNEAVSVVEGLTGKPSPGSALTLPLGDETAQLDLTVPEGSKPIVVTMTQLNREAGETMKQIVNEPVAALVTRHGRFVAAIVPLVPGAVEQYVFGEVSKKIAGTRVIHEGTRPVEYVAKDLDVDL